MPSTTTIDYECDNCSKRVRSDGRTPERWTRGGIGSDWTALSYIGTPPNNWYCDECNAASSDASAAAIKERKGLYA